MVSGDGDSGPQADPGPNAPTGGPSGSESSTASADARARALREAYRQQALKNIGGWSGALIAAIPTAVFIVVNALTTLRIAIIAAVVAAALLTGYRLARRQPIQQAVSGLLGVVVAALIAARTGQARGYFLLGIVTSFVYAVPFLVSIPLRRPLVGVVWEFLDPTPGTAGARRDDDTVDSVDTDDDGVVGRAALPPWHRVRSLLVAYQWTTVVATAVFLLRGFVQLFLYDRNATGWLAAARIAMGYPLFLVAIGVGLLLVRRARHDVVPTATGPTAAARPADTRPSDAANPADVASARREDGVA